MGEAPIPRKKSMCRIKRAWKRDSLCLAVWMMAVRRRPKPEVPAVVYNVFSNSSVLSLWGITARSSIV
jgi:hypothetical protein